MTKEEKFSYWLDAAEYDLKTANTMYRSKKYTYVFFMCQQALEKLMKGFYLVLIDENVPKVHNISFIFNQIKDKISLNLSEDDLKVLDNLSLYYIKTRYPVYVRKISSLISQDEAKKILNNTKRIFKWLMSQKML